MNETEYNTKLDTLYTLLLNKVSEKNKEKKETEEKYNKIIQQNEELIKRVTYLEKNVDLLKYFVNILYIPHLNSEDTMENFIFKNKFKLLTNSKYKKKPICNKIISGKIDTKYFKKTNKILIRTVKKMNDNICFITLTFYDNSTLINTYNFNHLLQVKKIDDYSIEIISDIIDCKSCIDYVKNKLEKNVLIKVQFFRIDEFYDIININL